MLLAEGSLGEFCPLPGQVSSAPTPSAGNPLFVAIKIGVPPLFVRAFPPYYDGDA